MLAEFYEQIKEECEFPFEIVFVSSDSDAGSFNEYYGQMPWTAIPFSSSNISQALGSKYGVRGIPHLLILTPGGEIKDHDARSTVSAAKGVVSKATAKWA